MDRRRVERHLIGCPQCRQELAALERALGVLHRVSAEPAAKPDASSLWPELARQIRESRRPARSPLGSFLAAWPRRFELGPVLGLGVGLLVTIVVAVGAHRQINDAQSSILRNARPIAPSVPIAALPAPAETTASGPEASRPQAEAPGIAETVPAPRVGYDLDHTMPTAIETREGKPQPTY
jgi:anti-sigma factor RsiW